MPSTTTHTSCGRNYFSTGAVNIELKKISFNCYDNLLGISYILSGEIPFIMGIKEGGNILNYYIKHYPMYHNHSMQPTVTTPTAQDIINDKYICNINLKVCDKIKME